SHVTLSVLILLFYVFYRTILVIFCLNFFFLLLFLLLPRSTLFPYTTLFRSQRNVRLKQVFDLWVFFCKNNQNFFQIYKKSDNVRSEEHTSELQSRENLVCRLLLEKKKKNL